MAGHTSTSTVRYIFLDAAREAARPRDEPLRRFIFSSAQDRISFLTSCNNFINSCALSRLTTELPFIKSLIMENLGSETAMAFEGQWLLALPMAFADGSESSNLRSVVASGPEEISANFPYGPRRLLPRPVSLMWDGSLINDILSTTLEWTTLKPDDQPRTDNVAGQEDWREDCSGLNTRPPSLEPSSMFMQSRSQVSECFGEAQGIRGSTHNNLCSGGVYRHYLASYYFPITYVAIVLIVSMMLAWYSLLSSPNPRLLAFN